MRLDDILTAISDQRSVSPRHLVEPGPNDQQFEVIIRAACAAPDHGALRPTRFVLIRGDSRAKFADLFAEANIEANPDCKPEEQEVVRRKAMSGAVLLGVIVRLDKTNQTVPAHEQWISAGAAIQNALLAAESLGFRCKVVSGKRLASRVFRRAFSLATNETFAAFVTIGTPKVEPKMRDRPSPKDLLTEW